MRHMCVVLLALLAIAFVGAAPKIQHFEVAPQCDRDACQLPDCRCSGVDIPGKLSPSDIPQFVYLTFDDAVNVRNIDFYREFFDNRTNPDKCPVSATFFVSHEYTDYSLIHEMHSKGHEIALHSISHTPMTDYWKNLDVEGHLSEFDDERTIIEHFANIPGADIKGMRLPLLQQSGENSYKAAVEMGLNWDCSWPTQQYITEAGLWPYTMDYKSSQDCPMGPCPKDRYPGFWIQPMIDLIDLDGTKCAMIDACTNVGETINEIYDFLVENFNHQYKGNKAPFGIYMHAAWFDQKVNAKAAYVKFLDHLSSLPDVYIINISRGFEWVKHPTHINDLGNLWPECPKTYEPTCHDKNAINCKLQKGEEERYMKVCASCPSVYPWMGNPLGNE